MGMGTGQVGRNRKNTRTRTVNKVTRGYQETRKQGRNTNNYPHSIKTKEKEHYFICIVVTAENEIVES